VRILSLEEKHTALASTYDELVNSRNDATMTIWWPPEANPLL